MESYQPHFIEKLYYIIKFTVAKQCHPASKFRIQTQMCPTSRNRMVPSWVYGHMVLLRVNQHTAAVQMTNLCVNVQQTGASLRELRFWRHLILWEVPPVWFSAHAQLRGTWGQRAVSWGHGGAEANNNPISRNKLRGLERWVIPSRGLIFSLIISPKVLNGTPVVSQSQFISQMGATD